MTNTKEEIQKEIERIIKTSGTPDEALSNICKAFPDVDYEVLKKSFDDEKKKQKNLFQNQKIPMAFKIFQKMILKP
ncbi:hypothetical protein [uncultured Treponema sp.]|uniref:hypothetical protein n=1 Tax=uncultured Treponema sp. TaxID=162155 RepID=UPI0025CF9344|nr:hypothetical protein [uncultured Treponema sp.]